MYSLPQNKHGFTLTELIIVSVILVILSSIGFISYSSYSSDARNTARKSDGMALKVGLRSVKQKTGAYPQTTGSKLTIVYSGSTGAIQGAILPDLPLEGVNQVPSDPKTKSSYLYSNTSNGQEFQIGMTLEETKSSIPKAYVDGDYRVATPSLPSILLASTLNNSTVDVSLPANQKLFILDGNTKNLPYSATGAIQQGATSLAEAIGDTGTGTTVNYTSCLAIYQAGKSIGSGSYYIRNSAGALTLSGCTMDFTSGSSGSTPSYSCASNPSFSNLGTLTTGTPNNTAQEWTYSATPGNCTYACLNGYSGTNCSIAPFICGTSTVTGRSPDITVYQTVLAEDGKCWLKSNLGTANVATAFNDSTAYGWLYQWGRLTDGHQMPTSGTTISLSSTDVPGNANFITAPSSPYDWRSPQNNTLSTIWGGVNESNSPCPADWRLPTQAEWATLVTTANITNYTTAFNSSLKLTVAGGRAYNDGSLTSQGSIGGYWASSSDSTYGYFLNFLSVSVNPANRHYRSMGFSVRCIRN